MNYGEIFSKSWKIVWKYKALWLFGLLSSCARSVNSGSGSNSGQSSSALPNSGVLAAPSLQWPGQINQWLLQLQHQWDAEPWAVLLFVLATFIFVFAIIIASIFFGTLGRAGVARGAWLADQNEGEKLGLGRIFSESLPYFWQILLLTVIVWLIVMVVVSVIMLPLMIVFLLTAGIAIFFLIPILLPLGLVMLVAGLVVFILTEQAVVAIVAEDLNAFAALERAWNLLRSEPLPHLVVGIVTQIGKGIVSFIIALPVFLTFMPLFFALFFETKAAVGIGAGLTGMAFMLYLPFILILTGILHAYIGSVWVITFRQLSKPNVNVLS